MSTGSVSGVFRLRSRKKRRRRRPQSGREEAFWKKKRSILRGDRADYRASLVQGNDDFGIPPREEDIAREVVVFFFLGKNVLRVGSQRNAFFSITSSWEIDRKVVAQEKKTS